MTPYEYAWAYVAALAGDPNAAVIDWRAIHDVNKEIPGHHRRGTLPQMWEWLQQMNAQGYGIFANVNALDGQGRELANVAYIRAQVVDLDNIAAPVNYERAAASNPHPAFATQTSPAKFHVYWGVEPYVGNDRFSLLQRKLRQVYDGDKTIIDATRVLRVPGFYHMKQPQSPHMVTCWALSGFGIRHPVDYIEQSYASVNVIDGGAGVRHDLGEPTLAAPSLDWLRYGLQLIDPNSLSRGEWVALTSAIKQAGWLLADPDTLYQLWAEWCARYETNDPGENLKQWNSIRNTELGWPSLLRRVPSLQAAMTFGGGQAAQTSVSQSTAAGPISQPPVLGSAAAPPMPDPPALDCSGEYLTHFEQQQWFKGCTFVIRMGSILTPDGRFLNATQFNGVFGGKKFIIDSQGKLTNEPWQAATRSTLWQVPKVDHTRFIPAHVYGEIVMDALGRRGVNMFKPAVIERQAGDPSPFLNHIAALLPDATDQRILCDFLAHNIKFPGHKIPWAFVIQSVEGAGKGVLKALLTHAIGQPYVHFPNAKELTASGSTFNAWLRYKLFILADEIKVDDKRDLIEVLKPMISETRVEVQAKGIDQDLEDNFANWGFFTNYKDAVPVSKNGRRYAIFYSPLQTEQDLIVRGMGEDYFNGLYRWMNNGGAAIVTNYFMEYPIERGAIPMRAPKTSSWDEAVRVSRSPIERAIIEAIEEGLPGFRGGWISSVAAIARAKALGVVRGSIAPQTIASIAESLGYVSCGRAERSYFTEDKDQRSTLFYFGQAADVRLYAAAQGYQ